MQDQNETDIHKLEKQLTDLSPSPLSENLISRMEQAMISWESHLPAEEKIVFFEKSVQPETQAKTPETKKSYFPVWSAAAAVALMGAVGFTFMSSDDGPANNPLSTYAITKDADQQAEPTNVTKHFSHQLMNASNEGITYAGNDKPYKVIRIEYTQDVEHVDDNGNTFIKKEPIVEHIMVPISVH